MLLDDVVEPEEPFKPRLTIDEPLHELVNQAEEILAKDEPRIFQRSGDLVYIAPDDEQVRSIKSSFLRYLLSQISYWKDEDDRVVHPPSVVARCLLDKGSWKSIKTLRSVSEFPPISPGGSIRLARGYHPETNVYFSGKVEIKLPDKPSKEQAKAAADLLLNLVSDFPFASPLHAHCWLAALLTPLSRYCHSNSVPIVLIQGNSPRVGKTRLAQLIFQIVNGTDAGVGQFPKNEDEQRKQILSHLRASKQLILWDNVMGEFGSGVINALITSRNFEDRVLGQGRILSLPNDLTLFITANNISLTPDTAERCLHIRLQTTSSRPQLRSGFKFPDILAEVRNNRVKYLTAALTILKAYLSANSPDQKKEPWGSFESWSQVVRNSLLWLGLGDVALTRKELEETADSSKEIGRSLVDGWLELQKLTGKLQGLTCREAQYYLAMGTKASRLIDALRELTKSNALPNPHRIARHLRTVRDRNFEGRILKCVQNDREGHRWFVVETLEEESK